MSVIEDLRQVLQDFVSPEFRTLAARIDSLEKRLETFDRSVETRLSNQDKLAEARHSEIMANFEAMKLSLQSNSRLERLEAQQIAAHQ